MFRSTFIYISNSGWIWCTCWVCATRKTNKNQKGRRRNQRGFFCSDV